jgi:hypothetical protein
MEQPTTPPKTDSEKVIVIGAANAAQYDFIYSDAGVAAYVGGRGAGKTIAGILRMLRLVRKNRLYMIVVPGYRRMDDSTLRAFEEFGGRHGLDRIVGRVNQSKLRARVRCSTGGTCEIVFRSCDTPDNLRGPSLSGWWLDEAELMHKDVYSIGLAQLREKGDPGWTQATFTPKGRAHWTYAKFAQNDRAFLARAKSRENRFLHAERLRELEEEYSGRFGKQELEGEFVQVGGELIPWDDMLACETQGCLWKDQANPKITGELYVGVDIGRSRDLAVIWTWEKIGDVRFAREIIALKNSPYDATLAQMRKAISRVQVCKAIIDQGTQGGPLAERMEIEFPGIAEGVTLGPKVQIRMAERLRSAFEEKRVRIPVDGKLRQDFQLVELADTGTIHTGRDSTVGHADRFWAGAMGYEPTMEEVVYSGRPRWG